jgi:hypothetical protein
METSEIIKTVTLIIGAGMLYIGISRKDTDKARPLNACLGIGGFLIVLVCMVLLFV